MFGNLSGWPSLADHSVHGRVRLGWVESAIESLGFILWNAWWIAACVFVGMELF